MVTLALNEAFLEKIIIIIIIIIIFFFEKERILTHDVHFRW